MHAPMPAAVVAAALLAVVTIGAASPDAGSELPTGPLPASALDGWAPVDQPAASSAPRCPDWPMYGASPARTFSTDCPSSLSPATAASLVPAWTVPTLATVTASPVVADGTVYVGDWSGTLHAIELASGTTRWTAATEPAPGAAFGPIVSSAAVATIDGRQLVIVGSGPRLYAFGAADGSPVWVTDLGTGEDDDVTQIESSPLVWDGVVVVGVDVHNATLEESGGIQGGVVTLDAATGAVRWTWHPQPDRAGCDSVWASPALDRRRGHLLVATGNCPHDVPWTPYVEAVTALRFSDGEPVWSFQPHQPNRRDWDFGATPALLPLRDGRQLVGAGNKDGHWYALHPADGELVHDVAVAEPGDVRQDFSIGGFIGSPAAWGGTVAGATALGGPPYLHGIAARSGEVLWSAPAGPSYASSAIVNGVVVTGALDDQLRVLDLDTGEILWQTTLAGPVSSGPAIVADHVVVGSGTSSSDACAKDIPPLSEACATAFDTSLGSTGGIHAFRVGMPGQRAATTGHGDGVLLGAEGNRLRAYDVATLEQQIVVASAADADAGRDINAQICGFPDGSGRFIAGEDTDQPDPPPSWGVFVLEGAGVGDLSARQLSRLAPSYQRGPDGAENYGCGFLADGRLLTTDVGNQFPGQAPTGQLILWFPPLDRPQVAYCKIDVDIPTAGGIHVDDGDVVLVASARPGNGDAEGAGVLRYTGDWPTAPTAAGGCGRTDSTDAPLVDDGRITTEVLIPADEHATTPSAVVRDPASGNLLVSSVFTGVIAEYTSAGTFVQRVLSPAGPPASTSGTPWGLAIDGNSALYYADLGIVGGGPEDDHGSVRRILREPDGSWSTPGTIAAGLDFADGVGVVTPVPRTDGGPAGGRTRGVGEQVDSGRGPLPATGGGFAAAIVAVLVLTAARRRG